MATELSDVEVELTDRFNLPAGYRLWLSITSISWAEPKPDVGLTGGVEYFDQCYRLESIGDDGASHTAKFDSEKCGAKAIAALTCEEYEDVLSDLSSAFSSAVESIEPEAADPDYLRDLREDY